MFVFRNNLTRFAATKFSSQTPHWSASSGSDSDDDVELPSAYQRSVSPSLWNPAAERSHLRFSNRVDGLPFVNNPSNSLWQGNDKRHPLFSASEYLRNRPGGMDNVLVMNLGDPWTDSTHLKFFDNRVVDLPSSRRHMAPGSDLIPLDILFTICSSMHSWLQINDKNVIFLHANNRLPGSGESTLKFVVGCYLAYLGDSDHTLPPRTFQKQDEAQRKANKAFVTSQEPNSDVSQIMYSIGMDTNKIESYGGPAKKRYAQYFLSILYAPKPPPSQENPLAVDNVVITGLDEIRTNLRVTRLLSEKLRDCVLNPVLVIYEKGKLRWKQAIPIKDARVEVQPEVNVKGDCVVGLWFVKDCISTNDPPVVAFSFNTAFMEAGVVRLSAGDLTCLGMDMKRVLDNPACNVSMELTLTYGDSSDDEDDLPSINWNDYRNKWLSQTGGLPSVYATVADFQKTEAEKARRSSECSEPPVVLQSRTAIELQRPEVESMPSIRPTMETVMERQLSKDIDVVESPYAKSSISFGQDSPPKRDSENDHSEEKKLEEEKRAPEKKAKEKEVKKRLPTRSPGPPPPPPPPKPKTRKSTNLSSSPSMKKQPVSKTKSFFWDILPKQSGTVWSELQQGELDEGRVMMLESLFANEGSTKKTKEAPKTPSLAASKKGSTATLSVGRANNVSIMMTRFRHFSGVDEICRAVLTGKGMTDEELNLLSQIGPTEMEVNELKTHKEEELSVPEKVLMGMTVVPRLRMKAACQFAMRHWERNYSEAINMLETIKRSCLQLKESKRLQRVFASVLSVGNTMNRGTSRGNASCIKIESLSRLWDTRVSGGNPTTESRTAGLQRAGSVPTAISQALEGPKVEKKIVTLLDFVAVVVHDNDVIHGVGTICDDYLSKELESLPDSVLYLEDGIEDLLSEVDKGFEMLEKEFRSMCGKSWSSVESTKLETIKIRNCDQFVEEQRQFLIKSHQFLIEAGGARNFLKQEQSVVEQHLSSVVQWLGETNTSNAKLHLKRLLDFAKHFDRSYSQLKTCVATIAE